MSAIAGCVRRAAGADRSLPSVDREATTWSDDDAVLGQHPTVAGDPEEFPVHDSSANLTVVASVRLDNRGELVELLDEPADASDGQLLLAAYRRWGDGCAAHLLGDFAFAIWDGTAQRLFLARDVIGVRPLYYADLGDRIQFASSAAALLRTPGVPATLDLPYLAAHFRNGQNYPHATRTFYAAIRKLAPAHTLVADGDGVRTERYWDPADVPDVDLPTPEAYAERLRELVEQAVRDRLPASGPVAAHVSGGLDCSAIAVLARRALEPDRMLYGYCWSPAPDGPLADDDERRLVDEVACAAGIPIVHATLTTADRVDRALSHPVLEQDAVALVHEVSLRRHAAANGVTTILSGWGGDEFASFNGRGHFADLFRRRRWRTLWRELTAATELHGGARHRLFVSRAVVPLLPDRVVERITPGRLPMMWHPLPLPGGFLPEFDAQLHAVEPLPHPGDRERPGVRAQQERLLARHHLTERLEGWAAAGARDGVRYEYPLLDRRVVEFALGAPAGVFFRHGRKRWLFRAAMTGALPPSVAWNMSKANPAIAGSFADSAAGLREGVHDAVRAAVGRCAEWCVFDRERALRHVTAPGGRISDERGYLRAGMQVELLANERLWDPPEHSPPTVVVGRVHPRSPQQHRC